MPRLGDERHDAAAGLAVLGLESVGVDRELRDRFDRGREYRRSHRRRPTRFVLTEMPSSVASHAAAWPPPSESALPRPFDSAVMVTRSNGLRIAPPTTSGSSSTKRFCNGGRNLGVLRLQPRRVGRDRDDFGQATDFKLNVEADRRRRRHDHVIGKVFFESRMANLNLISSRRERDVVLAACAADGGLGRIGRNRHNHDFCASHQGTARIGYDSSDITPIGLSKELDRSEKANERDCEFLA